MARGAARGKAGEGQVARRLGKERNGREIGLMADHGMYDIVARGEKDRNEITPGRSANKLGKM